MNNKIYILGQRDETGIDGVTKPAYYIFGNDGNVIQNDKIDTDNRNFPDSKSAESAIRMFTCKYEEMTTCGMLNWKAYKNLNTMPDILKVNIRDGVATGIISSEVENKYSNPMRLSVIEMSPSFDSEKYNYDRLLEVEKAVTLAKLLKSDKGDFRYIIDTVDDVDGLKVLTYAIRNGVDVRKIENLSSFNSEQLKALCYGINRGLDISKVANPFFSNTTMTELLKELENGDDIDEFVEAIKYSNSYAIYYAILLRRFGCEYSHLYHPNSLNCKLEEIYRSNLYSAICKKFSRCRDEFSIPYESFRGYVQRYFTLAFQRDDGSIFVLNNLHPTNQQWKFCKLNDVFENLNWKPYEHMIYHYISTDHENVLYFLPEIIRYKIDPEKTGLEKVIGYEQFEKRLNEIISVEKKFNLFE